MQPHPPQPDEAPGRWDSLAFGSPDPPPFRRRVVVIGLVGAGVLVLAGLGAGEFLPGRSGPEPRIIALTPHPAPPSTFIAMDGSSRPLLTFRPLPGTAQAPTGLGTDPTFDRYAHDCYRGVMRACDVLYAVSATGSRYEAYADTCAGRQPPGTDVYCVDSFPGAAHGR